MRTTAGPSPVFAGGAIGYGLYFALGWLSRVGPQKFIFQGRSIEAANDRLHLVSCGRFHEREPFGFLRLVIADDFYGICDQVIGGQPLFNIVRGDPDRQIAEEYGKAHSVLVDYSVQVGLALQEEGFRSLPAK